MDKKGETSPKRENSSDKPDLTRQLSREREKASTSENKDTTTGPAGKPYEPKYRMTQQRMEQARQLQNDIPGKKASTSASKDITTGLGEKPYEPKYELTRLRMEQARQLQNEIQSTKENKIEE